MARETKRWIFIKLGTRGATLGVDELRRLLGEICPMWKVKGQWNWSEYVMFHLVNANSQEPLGGFSSAYAKWSVMCSGKLRSDSLRLASSNLSMVSSTGKKKKMVSSVLKKKITIINGVLQTKMEQLFVLPYSTCDTTVKKGETNETSALARVYSQLFDDSGHDWVNIYFLFVFIFCILYFQLGFFICIFLSIWIQQ